MYGVLTPQHLNRLGLINDSLLYTTNYQPTDKRDKDENANKDAKDERKREFVKEVLEEKLKEAQILLKDKEIPKLFEDKDVTTDTILLLKQALNKLPQIPFSLAIDEYRWKYFEGNLREVNKEFWTLVEELQGVAAPGERGEEYFDAGAKFHVPDNTPYIR